MLTLYDADRCPYCARVRIVLAEKGLPYDTVVVDLDDRPAWIYEKNPLGKVPVLEEADFVLPESAVIMEYLEERYPEPPLWPAIRPSALPAACSSSASTSSAARTTRFAGERKTHERASTPSSPRSTRCSTAGRS